MQVLEQNIVEVGTGIVAHQCNVRPPRGTMGAGVAKAIRDKWPHVARDYHRAVESGLLQLGGMHISIAAFSPPLYVVHLAGQFNIGTRKQQTDYKALQNAVKRLNNWHKEYLPDMTVFMPYMIGCGYGGGDWKVVEEILRQEIPDAILCKLPK